MFTIHSKPGCPWCEKAKTLISQKGHQFTEISYKTAQEIADFKARGFRTFPQIYYGDKHIGGFEDLDAYFAAQEIF